MIFALMIDAHDIYRLAKMEEMQFSAIMVAQIQ
jgi:hypothetical protein